MGSQPCPTRTPFIFSEFVLNSNDIEGIAAGPGSPHYDQHMVALTVVIDEARSTHGLSPEELTLYLHRVMMHGVMPVNEDTGYMLPAGSLRDSLVSVGGEICPFPELVPDMLKIVWDLIASCGTAHHCWEAHYAFESVHPFMDGNGRVGRLVLFYCREKLGLEREYVPFDAQLDYYGAITDWRENKAHDVFGKLWQQHLDKVEQWKMNQAQALGQRLGLTPPLMK